jgi:hypothetical protein
MGASIGLLPVTVKCRLSRVHASCRYPRSCRRQCDVSIYRCVCCCQVDYSRHLDEIGAHVERALLAAVRRRLMKGRRDVTEEARGLLRRWEDYRQLADRGTVTPRQRAGCVLQCLVERSGLSARLV